MKLDSKAFFLQTHSHFTLSADEKTAAIFRLFLPPIFSNLLTAKKMWWLV
jgi:hypothetical protein